MKRIVTIQDISCLGKCSLTVALPVISAEGIECVVVPTAVLSTHTMFNNFTFRDLTDDIKPIAEHWKKEGFDFDAIYTGYLGSERQLEIVSDFIDEFKRDNCIVFIDPVMADNGKLYAGFKDSFVEKMKKLISKADIVIPNITEGSFLTGMAYREGGGDGDYVRSMLKKLTDLGAKTAVLTGVSFGPGSTGAMSYEVARDRYYRYAHKKINVSFHGTGDLFSSTCIGALTKGANLDTAIAISANFTVKCIETTMESKDHVSYGVEFEKCIPYLLEQLRSINSSEHCIP